MINLDALSNKPTLTGENLRLVPLTLRHAEPFWHAVQDPELRRLTGTVREFTLTETEQWCAGRADQPDRLDLAIEDPATGAFLGELALNELDPDNDSASFRIALAPGNPGRGIGTEATRMLLRYAFEEVRLHRVHLEVFEYNPRAIRSYEKSGFVHEGRSRAALKWGDTYYDVLHMAVLREEWPAAAL